MDKHYVELLAKYILLAVINEAAVQSKEKNTDK